MKKITVICKKSVYKRCINSKNTKAKKFANTKDKYVEELIRIHKIQKDNLCRLINILEGLTNEKLLQYKLIERGSGLTKKKIGNPDLVISFGGDGTFLYTSQFLSQNIPILGINPNPKTSIGHYCNHSIDNIEKMLRKFIAGKLKSKKFNRIILELDGKVLKYKALNDCLIAHKNPAAMTKYLLSSAKEKNKTVRGSGLLVSTSTGASGWIYNLNGKLFKDNDTMQLFNRGIRKEKSSFSKTITVKMLSNNGKIYIDGDKISSDFPMGALLKLKLGQKISIF